MAKSAAEIPPLRTGSTGCDRGSRRSRRSDPKRRTRFDGSRAGGISRQRRAHGASLSPPARRSKRPRHPPAGRRVALNDYVIAFERLGMGDVERVGGKNASLGELIGSLAPLGVQVPGGFATTAHAYREFLHQDGLDERIRAELAALDVEDVARLAASGERIRGWILA